MKRPSRRERENMSVEELEQLLEEYRASLRVEKARLRKSEEENEALRAMVQSKLKEIGLLLKLEQMLAKMVRQRERKEGPTQQTRHAKANTDANESGG